jgi:hypothetical protein
MRNWKTSLTGLAMILMAVSQIAMDPQKTDQSHIVSLLGGFGLLLAKDYDKSGTAKSGTATGGGK